MIAEFHAKALAEIAGVKLVAAYNRSPAKGRDFATKHGIAFAETPEALLANPAVDIVCLCTPSGDHLAPAIACAKSGKHVVVEKPLEVTLARCDELTAACAKAGVTVAGILPRRFGAGAVALKSALGAGRFGRLTMAGALIPWWRTQAYYDSAAWRGTFALDGGGAVMNQGIHTVDLLLWFLGAPKKVSATAGLVAHEGIEVEDIAHGLAFVARWNGQTKGDFAYSVAEHSLLVTDIFTTQNPNAPVKWQLAALLHDAPEYVIGDMISPVKAAVGPSYGELDDRLTAAIHSRFGLPAQIPVTIKKQIKAADKISAWLEAVQIAGFTAAEADRFFGKIDSNMAETLKIRLRPPVDIRNDFTAKHRELMEKL